MANTVYIGPAEKQPDVTELPAAASLTPGEILRKVCRCWR